MSYTPPNRSFPHSSHTRVRNTDTTETRANFPAAFQQGRREDTHSRTGMPQGASYRSWKTTGTMEPAKQKQIHIDSTEDFPSLSGKETPVTRSALTKDGASLAQKLKESIDQERDEATQRRYKKENERWDVISLPFASAASWAARQQEKKMANEHRQREADEEEERYRWNMSNDMTDHTCLEGNYEESQEDEYNHQYDIEKNE